MHIEADTDVSSGIGTEPGTVNEMRSILVAVDPRSGTPDLIPIVAIALGAPWKIELIHALDGNPPELDRIPSIRSQLLDGREVATAFDPALETEIDGSNILHSIADELRDHSLEVDIHQLFGPPVDVVLTAAETMQSLMIIVPGHRGAGGQESALGSFTTALLKVADRPVLVLPTSGSRADRGFLAAVDRLVTLIDREDDTANLGDLRAAAQAQLRQPDAREDRAHLGAKLMDALHRFETTHPTLTKAINDVSYYLSGMGI